MGELKVTATTVNDHYMFLECNRTPPTVIEYGGVKYVREVYDYVAYQQYHAIYINEKKLDLAVAGEQT